MKAEYADIVHDRLVTLTLKASELKALAMTVKNYDGWLYPSLTTAGSKSAQATVHAAFIDVVEDLLGHIPGPKEG
jgi:hypothetical protein